MNKSLATTLVFILACVSGVASGSWLSYMLYKDINRETMKLGDSIFSPKTEQSRYELNVTIANDIYDSLNKNERAKMLRIVCNILMFNAENLNPEVWAGETKYEYAVELRENSLNNLLALRSAGYCE